METITITLEERIKHAVEAEQKIYKVFSLTHNGKKHLHMVHIAEDQGFALVYFKKPKELKSHIYVSTFELKAMKKLGWVLNAISITGPEYEHNTIEFHRMEKRSK